jgi:hypothetical protein
MATKTKKPKTKTNIHTIRRDLKKDNSPSWEGNEEWSSVEYIKAFHDSMNYYNLQIANKDVKSTIIQWMISVNYDKEILAAFKKTKDWRCSSTMSSIASCLMRGMPAKRDDFNNGKDCVEWLTSKILEVIQDGRLDVEEDEPKIPTNPQNKIQEVCSTIIADIDIITDSFCTDIEKFEPKTIKMLDMLKKHNIKPVHAKIIKDYYNNILMEMDTLVNGTPDDQLKECYNSYTKKSIRKMLEFYTDLDKSCDIIMQDIKKPRAPKPVNKEKVVEKLKYKKEDDRLKISSVDPVSIIGAKELFCYDTKTRKLYRYLSNDDSGLSIKNSNIVNYNESDSIGKTLLKPVDHLTKFKNSGKIAMATFLDTIDTTEIKANGKITENCVLLRIVA